MTGHDQSTPGVGFSKSSVEGLSRSAWPALSNLPAGRDAPILALVPALGGRGAREVGMRARVEIVFVSGYCSGCLT